MPRVSRLVAHRVRNMGCAVAGDAGDGARGATKEACMSTGTDREHQHEHTHADGTSHSHPHEAGTHHGAEGQTAQGYQGQATEGEIRVPVAEERLHVETRQAELGEVQLRKTVEEEQQTVPVELEREEVHVERRD